MGGVEAELESAGRRARLGRWLFVVAIVASALGLGSLHTPVLAGAAVLAAASFALLWFDAEPQEPRPAASALVLVAIGLTVWTALQLVPLPRGLVAALSPERADVWARCLSPLREDGPAFAALSLDPVATRVQVLRGVTYLLVLAAALRVARRQDGVVFLERALVASSLVIAGAALLHPALGARKVFGLYEPTEKLGFDPHHLGPLLNTNHLAAYLDIGLLVAAQSAIERRDSLPRPLALTICLLLGATVVWTLSRGGSGAMVLGVVLVAVLVFTARRSRRSQMIAPLAGILALLGGASVLFLALFDESRSKFSNGDFSKLELVRASFGLLKDYGAVGIGRGAFESTFPKLRTAPEYWVNTHPEDVVAQWTTEWGVPVALAALVAIAWALQPRSALARSRPPAGAWAALVAVAAHNLVDFSSEVPGVVVALAVCAAIVTGGSGGPAASRALAEGSVGRRLAGAWSRRPGTFAYAVLGALVVALVATLPFVGDELGNEQRAFRDLALDRSVAKEAFRAEARAAMLRHPAEPYFPFVGAVRAIVRRDEGLLPWAARALDRSPVYGRVHLLVARSLFARNPSQARLEYRLACAQESTLCYVDEILPLVGSYDEAMELVPEGPRGLLVLKTLTARLSSRLPATVFRLDREVAARDRAELGPIERAAEAGLHDLRQHEPWCDPAPSSACVTEALADARRVRGSSPDRCVGHALAAEIRVAAGEATAGFAELDEAIDHVVDRSACARRLVELALETNSMGRVDGAIERLLNIGCDGPRECADDLVFAANVETRRGKIWRGLILLKKAWEREPEREDLLIQVANQASAQGFHGEALDAYGRLADRHPEDPHWADAVVQERRAVARKVFEPARPDPNANPNANP